MIAEHVVATNERPANARKQAHGRAACGVRSAGSGARVMRYATYNCYQQRNQAVAYL